MTTKTISELCEMTGIPMEHIKKIIEMAIQMGAMKKVGEDKYEMTGSGVAFSRSLFSKDPHDFTSGNWVCIKCKTINNALNGMNCIKCNYSFEENIASQMFEAEKKELKYPKVTDRETLIFLLGQVTGMSMTFPQEKNISFAQRFEKNKRLSRVMIDVMMDLKNEFSNITEDEFSECLIQLNATRTAPMLHDAILRIIKIMKS